MNIRRTHVFRLFAFTAILAIAAFCAETRFPGKTSASSTTERTPRAATITETVEETVTLSSSVLKNSGHGYQWYSTALYCGPSFYMFPSLDDAPGSVVAGYEHHYDRGASVAGCPDGAMAAFRGMVWFDLTDIVSKAPPLHVFVKSATLHFTRDRSCEGEELLIGTQNWLSGYPDNTLVSGDSFKKIPASASADTAIDTQTIVNNWVRGEEHGGYANYGFVFRGPFEDDLKYEDNNACLVRYSNISLTVTYRYDRADNVPRPTGPVITVNPAIIDTRKNVALAVNGGTVTAQNYTQDGVIPGAHYQPSYAIDGARYGHILSSGSDINGFWRDEHGLPSWLEVDFSGTKTINEVDVFTIADFPANLIQADPSPTQTFTQFGTTSFDVQYWDGSSWVAVSGGSVSGNNLVWRKFTFAAIKTNKIRVVVNSAVADSVARIAEVEAWGK